MVRELPPAHPDTILIVEVGSTSHGTGLPNGEDLDLLAVMVESKAQVIGLSPPFPNTMERTQPDGVRSGPGDTDRTTYSLRSFLRLAAAGNPSILAALWSPVITETPLGTDLRSLRTALVGRHVIPKYRGYMYSQGLRLLGLKGPGGHGKRGSGQRPELVEKYGYDTKFAMHAARLGFQCIELVTTGNLQIPMRRQEGDWLRSVRNGEIPFGEWWDRCIALDATMEALTLRLDIPAGPDWSEITDGCIRIHELLWAHRCDDPARN